MIDLSTVSAETRKASRELLDALRDSAETCIRQMEDYGVADAAALARRIRHCRWRGQHWSERLWGSAEEAAFPFEGASDFRRRDADFIANERVGECFNALMRSRVRFGGADRETASWAAREWDDAKTRRLGSEWVAQNLLLSNYLHGAGRGVAGLWTGWMRTRELRPRRRGMDYLASAWTALRAGEGEDAAMAMQMFQAASLQNPKFLSDALLDCGMVKTRALADEAAASLQTLGWFEEISPATVEDRPFVRALALGDTLWIPVTTPVCDGDGADEMHLTEWLDRATVLARSRSENWDRAFTEELLTRPGEGLFPLYAYDEEGDLVSREESARDRGLFQLVRTFFKGVASDGSVGRYEVLWSPLVRESAALGVRLVRSAHGKWPVQIYSSEVVGPFALDARSVPLLAAGVQEQGKISFDTMANVSMMQLSPIVTKGRRDQGQLLIEPLGEIRLGASGDARFMTPPQVPAATMAWQGMVDKWRDLYFGIPNAELPPQLWQTEQARRVWLYLSQSAETVRRLLTACACEAAADTLPAALRANPADAYGLPVRISCDPHEWDLEYISKTATVVNNLLMPMDRKGVLKTSDIVGDLLLSMLPEHSGAVETEGDASDSEVRDEERNLLLIRAGVRPKVPEGGSADYQARLAFYENLMQANPDAFADMGPDKQALLQEHMAALRQQAVQYGENRAIGRYGARQEAPAVEEV